MYVIGHHHIAHEEETMFVPDLAQNSHKEVSRPDSDAEINLCLSSRFPKLRDEGSQRRRFATLRFFAPHRGPQNDTVLSGALPEKVPVSIVPPELVAH